MRPVTLALCAPLLFLMSSCFAVVSFDAYDTTEDAKATTRARYKVVGTVEGLDPGARVSLSLNGGTAVEVGNEPFELSNAVQDGEAYALVVTQATHACTATPASGVIAAADVQIAVHCLSDDATLSSLTVARGSEPGVLAPSFDPAVAAYRALVPLLPVPLGASLTATPRSPSATVQIGGGSAPPGLPLPPGPVDVTVTSASGRKNSYTVVIDAASTYFKASNTRKGAYFGAALSLSGDTLAVGAAFESSNAKGVNGNQNDTTASGAGAVYVYARAGGVWSQQAYLKASNTRTSAAFGTSVALVGDTLAVGAPGESSAATGIDGNQSDTSARAAGAVYVFRRSAGVWSQEAFVKASNTRADTAFGGAVAISGDTLAVGAKAESSKSPGINGDQTDASMPLAGAVYVFTRSGATWSQQAYVKASNPRFSALFGSAVALSGDTLAVGAPGENSNATGVNGDQTNQSASGAGAVYVFTRSAGTWSQEAYVKASNTRASSAFGTSVAVTGDTLAVGAEHETSAATGIGGDQSDTSAKDAGAVYMFTRNAGMWSQEAYIKASNTRAGARFGNVVALAGDVLAVGAPFEASAAKGIGGDPNDSSAKGAGAVYLFARASAAWSQQAYVKAPNSGASAGFGCALTFFDTELGVGSSGEASDAKGVDGDPNNTLVPQSGAAYLYLAPKAPVP